MIIIIFIKCNTDKLKFGKIKKINIMYFEFKKFIIIVNLMI